MKTIKRGPSEMKRVSDEQAIGVKLGGIFLILAALLAFATLPEGRVTMDNISAHEVDLPTRVFARVGLALADQTVTHLGVVKLVRIVLVDGTELHAIGVPFVGRYYGL
jgi:hypothetical protein